MSDICSKCGSWMTKYSGRGDFFEIWCCPVCGLRHVFANYRNLASDNHGAVVYGRSFEDIDGLPAKESSIAVLPDGSLFEQRLRFETAEFVIERWFEPQAPYRRGAKNGGKREQELRAVEQLLPEFNRLHRCRLTRVEIDREDRDVDVIAADEMGRYQVRFQVVVADDKIWRFLAVDATLHERISERELHDRVRRVLNKKAIRASKDVVLVLDGPWATPRGAVERLAAECRALLDSIGFREVWYSERWPGNVVVRLKAEP